MVVTYFKEFDRVVRDSLKILAVMCFLALHIPILFSDTLTGLNIFS